MNETITSYKFIERPTAKSLQDEMLRLQAIHGERLHFDFIQFAQGKWFAWYKYTQVIAQRLVR
jgi:hypothetical protein